MTERDVTAPDRTGRDATGHARGAPDGGGPATPGPATPGPAAVGPAVGEDQEALAWAVLDALARAAPIGHMLLDTEGRYLRLNDAMLAMNGGTREERIGRSVAEVQPALAPAVLAAVDEVLRSGRPLLGRRLEGEIAAHPGETRVWRLTYYPVVLPDGTTIAIGVICEDVTEADRAAHHLDVVQQVTAALLPTVTVDEAVAVVLRAAPALVGATGGSVAVGERGEGELRVAVAAPGTTGVAWRRVPASCHTVATAVVARGAAMWLDSPEAWGAELPGSPPPPGEQAWVGVPLSTHRGAVGAVAFAFPAPRPFSEAARRLLTAVADQCAVALERALLFERAEAARHRTVCLQQATAGLARATTEEEIASVVLEGARAGLGAVRGGLGLVDRSRRVHRLVATFGWDHLATPDLLEERPLEASSLSATALRRGEPLYVTSAGELATLMPAERARRVADVGDEEAWAVLPLRGVDQWLGTLSLSFPVGYRFDEEERAFLASLAGQAAQALERIHRHQADHQVAVVLQRALLPERLPRVPGLAVAVRYQAGTGDVQVGGDWYDVFRLDGGEVALVVGDVVGHDLAAAGTMGRLRAQLRACARAGAGPGLALGELDRLVHRSEDEDLATLVVAVWEPGRPTVRLAAAGHPPPLVLDGAGARFVDADPGPPVGAAMRPARYPDVALSLDPAGTTLVLYSDGLVERRGGSLEDGLQALRQVATATADADPNDLADRLVADLAPPAGWEDDVALLVCRLASRP